MERLGSYIFVFFFLGICFFERARTKGKTGSLWRIFSRNFAILLFAFAAFLAIGRDWAHPAAEGEEAWFRTLRAVFHFVPPYGEDPATAKAAFSRALWVEALRAATAGLIVAAGIWELRLRNVMKWLLAGLFILAIYPLAGFLRQAAADYHDHAGALQVWALPAMFVLAVRLAAPFAAVPGERTYDLRGYKILPGMKHRFFLSRGLGFLMVFLVLNAATLVNLPLEGSKPKTLWLISKTLTVIPASFTMAFCGVFFFGLFGPNKPARLSCATPIFALLAALVSTQSCQLYTAAQAITASVTVTFLTLLYLRLAPLTVRFWDPLCSTPVFLIGGSLGVLMASQETAAHLSTQLAVLLRGLLLAGGSGALLTWGLMRAAWFRSETERLAEAENLALAQAEAKAKAESLAREEAAARALEEKKLRRDAKARARAEARQKKEEKARLRKEAKEERKAPSTTAETEPQAEDEMAKPPRKKWRFFGRGN